MGSPICTALAASSSSRAPISDHTGDRSGGRSHRDALTDQDGRIPAADLPDEEYAGGVNVLHDQADLVDVPDERDARAPAGVHRRERAAQRIAAHVREFPCRFAPDLGCRPLVARGPDCLQQTVQQDARRRVDALVRHAPKDS